MTSDISPRFIQTVRFPNTTFSSEFLGDHHGGGAHVASPPSPGDAASPAPWSLNGPLTPLLCTLPVLRPRSPSPGKDPLISPPLALSSIRLEKRQLGTCLESQSASSSPDPTVVPLPATPHRPPTGLHPTQEGVVHAPGAMPGGLTFSL